MSYGQRYVARMLQRSVKPRALVCALRENQDSRRPQGDREGRPHPAARVRPRAAQAEDPFPRIPTRPAALEERVSLNARLPANYALRALPLWTRQALRAFEIQALEHLDLRRFADPSGCATFDDAVDPAAGHLLGGDQEA